MVKPDVVALVTVPDAPPAAGPERALDPPPAVVEDGVAVVEGDVAVAEGEEPQAARSTIAAHAAVPAKIHRERGRDRVVRVSGELVGFRSFMIAFLPAQEPLCRECEPHSWEDAVRRL
jgi:hypothetical protein